VEPLHLATEVDPRYVTVTLARLQLPSLTRRIADLKSKLQRLNPVQNPDEHLRLFGELVSLEQHARALRNQAAGGL
jgi:DNA primase